MLLDGGDGALDGGGVDERTDRVVDEDDVVVGRGGQGGEGIGDGVLTGVAAGDDVDLVAEVVLGDEFGDAALFGFADGNVDGGDRGDGEEGAQGMKEDGHALERDELFGCAPRWWRPCGYRFLQRGE